MFHARGTYGARLTCLRHGELHVSAFKLDGGCDERVTALRYDLGEILCASGFGSNPERCETC